MASLRWLHISDFHLDDKKDTYESDLVLNALVKSVREWDEKPDVIFATGDVADKGKPAEYVRATKFFDDLLEAAGGLSKDRLFVIPGNHDVDREAGEYLKRTLESEAEAVKYFAPGGRVPHRAKLEAYDQWYAEYFAGTARGVVDGVPWSTCRVHEVVEVDGVRLQVLAVNSALFCQGDDDNAKLWIGRRCLEDAVEELKDDVVRVCLIHHPVDWLSYDETAVVPALLHRSVDIVLRGHLHQPRVVAEYAAKNSCIQIASGATFQGRRWQNQILVGKLNVAASTLRVRPFAYFNVPAAKWDLDTSLYDRETEYEEVFEKLKFKAIKREAVKPPRKSSGAKGGVRTVEESDKPTGEFATALPAIMAAVDNHEPLDASIADRLEKAEPRSIGDLRVQRAAKWLSARYGYDERFVNLTVRVDTGRMDRDYRDLREEQTRFSSLDAVLAYRQAADAFVVLGEPGCGKTMLLRHLDYHLAVDGLRSNDAPTPFFLSLNTYRPIDGVPSPRVWLENEWNKRMPGVPFRFLLTRRVTFLLDALNEMPHRDAEEFKALADLWRDFIRDEVKPRPGVRLVFSCRSYQFSRHLSGQGDETTHVEVERLDDDQMREFLEAYLTKDLDAGETLERIREDVHQFGLFRVPFYLRMLTRQIGKTGTIPSDRAQLFCGFLREQLRKDENYNVLRLDNLLTADDFDFLNDPEIELRGGVRLPENGVLIPCLTRLAVGMLDQRGANDLDKLQIRVPEADAFAYMTVDNAVGRTIVRAGQALTVLDRDRIESEVMFFHQLWQEFFAARDPHARQAILSVQEGYEEAAVISTGFTTGATDASAHVHSLLAHDPITAARSAMDLGGRLSAADRSAIQHALIQNMQHINVPTKVRVEAGRLLSEIGDPRRGVGLVDDIPDIDWVKVPAGPFYVGSNDSEEGSFLPLTEGHADGFLIARNPVTWEQFNSFVEDPRGYRNSIWWKGLDKLANDQQQNGPVNQMFTYKNHPRDRVSWFEAVAFCRWLSSLLGLSVRLPTEEEWEKAARGTDGRRYPWGDDFDPRLVNTREAKINSTTAVGTFLSGASPYGVLDMSGNIWEWCLNTWDGDLSMSAETDRVIRGGGWCDGAQDCLSGHRGRNEPHGRGEDLGFRLAADQPSEK